MKTFSWFLLAALGAGCARFEPLPLSPARTAAELESRSLTNATLKTFLEKNFQRELTNWPAASWDLPMLTLAAFYYHPSVAVARTEWQAAQAGTRTAAGRPNPTVSVVPGFDPGIPDNPVPWVVPVTFDVPIETAGKRSRRIATARHLSEAARLNLATVAWQVRSNVRSSLLDRTAAQQREALLRAQLAAQEKIVKLLEKQAEAGAIAPAELAPAHAALAKAGADLADAERQFAEAHVRLADALGLPASALDEVSLKFDLSPLPAVDHLTSADARRAALQSRSDIRGALAEYAASQTALQLEIAKQYPDVRLGPGYIFNAGSAGDSQWELGLTVELPVLNRNQGPIAEAKARRANVAARFVALQAKVIADIERAVAVYGAGRTNLAALQRGVTAQQAKRKFVAAQLEAGAVDQLTVHQAEFEWLAARLAHLDGQARVQQALGALEDALQRLLEAAPASISALLGAPQLAAPSPPAN